MSKIDDSVQGEKPSNPMNEQKTDKTDNEVKLNVLRSIKVMKRDEKFCRHNSVEVDEKFRVINCADCGRVMDAFEYVLRWAREAGQLENESVYLRREVESLRIQRDTLAKEITYIKRKKKTNDSKMKKLNTLKK